MCPVNAPKLGSRSRRSNASKPLSAASPSSGSKRRLGALLLGVYQGKDLVYIGHTGTGFNARTLTNLRERLEPLIQKSCPFSRRPKPNAAVHWVRPELVCEISFVCWTLDGMMRQRSFKGMRDDVAAATVHREEEDGEDAS